MPINFIAPNTLLLASEDPLGTDLGKVGALHLKVRLGPRLDHVVMSPS